MSTYRYVSTDVVTGRVLADALPLTVESFARNLNSAGTLTGNLNLQADYAANKPFVSALECRRAMLWVLQDEYPVWVGIVWDWPMMTLQGGQLPISAQSIESLFDYRLVTATIEYAQVDMFTVFADLATYGLTKSSAYITALSPTPPPSALVKAAAACPSIVIPNVGTCGVPWSATYMWSDLRKVSDVWADLSASGSLEYTFDPGLDDEGGFAAYLRLGYLQLGRPLEQSGVGVSFPGNATDYGYQRTGSQSANYIWAQAPPNGSDTIWLSQYPHGADLTDLGAGYPLLEDTTSWNGSTVTLQSQVDGFADGQVALRTEAMTLPVINIPGGVWPALKDIVLGDTITFAATSALHPPAAGGQPGLQLTVRVTGWTCYPPADGQQEYIQLATSSIGVM